MAVPQFPLLGMRQAWVSWDGALLSSLKPWFLFYGIIGHLSAGLEQQTRLMAASSWDPCAWKGGGRCTPAFHFCFSHSSSDALRLLLFSRSCCHCGLASKLPAGLHNGLGGVLQTAGCILRADIRASSGPQPGWCSLDGIDHLSACPQRGGHSLA